MSFAPPLDHLLLRLSSPVSKEARGVAQVRTKIARQADNEDELAAVRDTVDHLVRGEEYATGSRMLAYANVGRAIGKSASWVRKLVGRQTVALQYVEFLQIVRAYGVLCARIEAAAERERLLAERLRSEVDAAHAGAAGVVAGATPPACRGEDGRDGPALMRPLAEEPSC